MTDPDVVVLRAGTEGLSMTAYARALRERLPDRRICHARTPASERRLATHTRAITGIEPSDQVMATAEDLVLFACTFAGTDHLPIERLTTAGVIVTNAGGIHAPGIAEQVIGYMLTFARGLREAWRNRRNHEWRHYRSSEIAGSTVTVVGLGSIGSAVVERLSGFDVETIGIRYTPEKGGSTDEVIGYNPSDVSGALARTDYLVLACPLTETTAGLIDSAAFETLPPSAVVINVARGAIIDTAALVAALQSGAIRGAALDVTDPEPLPSGHPLWQLERCLITPHMGGHTPRHWARLADIVAHNVRALDAGDHTELRNVVARP